MNADIGENDTDKVTFGALATTDDKLTDDPDVSEAKIAGKVPWELAATTSPDESRIAASIDVIMGNTLLSRSKVPNVKERSELATTFAPKVISITEAELGMRREEDMMLLEF